MSRTNPKFVPAAAESTTNAVAARTRRVRVLGRLLDSSIPIPGTAWKIGLDPILGLIPGVGDLMGAVLSGYIVLEAARADIPSLTLVRMLVNIGIDTLVGAVPALGDVFDAAWKANTKNVALLENHLSRNADLATGVSLPRRERNLTGIVVLAVLALVVILGAGLALGIYAARLLWNMKIG